MSYYNVNLSVAEGFAGTQVVSKLGQKGSVLLTFDKRCYNFGTKNPSSSELVIDSPFVLNYVENILLKIGLHQLHRLEHLKQLLENCDEAVSAIFESLNLGNFRLY